ncbi:peptidoglycan/xylan/chitin deacetylase (PgdA/CDA1 family) [Hamadaea flava]|uniref:Polysaccharide deacetylase family protein n=1 Tax=Hamadaea flava TaxID=1742688 RepID=A0ABV8LM24_9ACTN|nr:polysaccharide deacetylase family protein [Hamadaea flava]MCP2323984.1 peptidoglycan/xylan/chitin deacetylase (PgdA/CDA1 family) [Hamadaea flava]
MVSTPRPARRILAIAAAVAAAAAGAVAAVTLVATPSQAATCNGYVGLTFDDGPTAGNTQNLLNALTSNGLRATFFDEGKNVQANPSLVQATKNAGMWIANHSWDHPHMTQLSTAQMATQIGNTQSAIQQITGAAPKLFRPPYGETSSALKSVEAQYGLTEIIWDVDSQDWNNASVASIVAANARLTNGQIILMHDWPANTVAAIPQIAAGLASRNLCAGMISPTTGRAVAPDGTQPPASQSPSAQPSTPPPTGGGCRVTSQISAWNTGLTNNLTITNTSGSAVTNWRLTFTLPGGQTITSGWNATYSPASGAVTATNAGYNSIIAAGGSVGIGYQANHTGNTGAPTGFALNGVACS